MKNSIVSLRSTRYLTKGIVDDNTEEKVTDRQERVPGFNQSIMSNMRVLQIGAGGLGGEIAQGLVRKGVGVLRIFDGDTVELSNLSRQFFYKDDLYQNKAICLAKNLVKEGVSNTEIIAHPMMIQKAIEDNVDMECDIVICAPDNDDTRVFVSKYFYNKVPVIFTGLDAQANTGYVFIQVPGKACVGCALPHTIKNKREACPNIPSIIDLVKIMGGFVLFAIDSTLMQRKRSWDFRQIFLDGVPEFLRTVTRQENCSLCKSE